MAGERGGKDLLLKVESSPSVYTTLGGLRSKSFSLSADGIDVTNHDSNQLRELLDECGTFSMSLSGSGIHNGDGTTLNYVEDQCIAQTLTRFQIIDSAASGRTYTVLCKVTSWERTGEYNGEQTYSVSLESSGGLTIS